MTEAQPATTPAGSRRPRRRLRAWAFGIGAALALAGTAAAAVGMGGRDPVRPAASDLSPATATVTRETLVETLEVEGTLGYGEALPLTGKASGTVTWLPAVGARIKRNQAAYKVDERPVPLLYGTLPLYRAMKVKDEGPDVTQLEQNLRALGYELTVDGMFSAATAKAVKSWQKALGVPETGVVDPSAAVVAPGEIRVAERKVRVGDTAGGDAVLTYTGLSRVVTADLKIEDQLLARRGATVTVELPDGKTTQGTIAEVGTVVTSGQDDAGGSGKPTVKLLVTVRDQKALGDFVLAPVSLSLVADSRQNVLVVPVAALLALAEGGYAVEVVEGGSSRLVAVELGMFSLGKVEVRGDGITAGTVVGVPR